MDSYFLSEDVFLCGSCLVVSNIFERILVLVSVIIGGGFDE